MNGGEVLFHYVASPQGEIKALNQIDFSVLAKRDCPIKSLYFCKNIAEISDFCRNITKMQIFDWLVPYH